MIRGLSQPQLMNGCQEVLKDRVLHSSQITGFATNQLKDPAPKVIYAVGLLNEAIADGTLFKRCGEPWDTVKPMLDSEGVPLNRSTFFLAFVGDHPMGGGLADEIPMDHGDEVMAIFGKWVRHSFALKGVDYVVDDYDRLTRAAGSLKGLLRGKEVDPEDVVGDLPAIAELIGTSTTECWDVISGAIADLAEGVT